MEISQEELEQRLMDLLLQGDHPALNILRQQYATAKVTRREFTGVGFWTFFEVSDNAPLLVEDRISSLLDLQDIQLENLPNGAACDLSVRDGKLSCLDCYAYTDPWPEQIIIKSLPEPLPEPTDKYPVFPLNIKALPNALDSLTPYALDGRTLIIIAQLKQELKKLKKKASKEKPSVHVGAVVKVGVLIILSLVSGFYLFSGFLTILGIIELIGVYIQREKFDAKQAEIDEEIKLIREKIAKAKEKN